MPLLKSTDPLPERAIVLMLYGDPGIGKTSVFNTANKGLSLDFDRGTSRAILRKDTFVVDSWDELETEEEKGLFKPYNAIGIDTPKAAIDDFIMPMLVRAEPKYKRNKLQAYGEAGSRFKGFVSRRREENADTVFVCHGKKEKDGDNTINMPDITGGSQALLLRIADSVGYMTMESGKRVIKFQPSETTYGKDVAELGTVIVPHSSDPSFKTFLADIILKVRKAVVKQSDDQIEAMSKIEEFTDKINGAATPEELNALTPDIIGLKPVVRTQLRATIKTKAEAEGWVFNTTTSAWEKAAVTSEPPTEGAPVIELPADDKKVKKLDKKEKAA